MQFLSRSRLQLQNRTCKPGAMFSAICRRYIAAISQGFRTCLKLDAILAPQKLHRVAATKTACVHGPLGPVHTYPDIFESATFSFRIRLPSTRIRRIRQRIRKTINPLSRVEKKISATNPITCGRGPSLWFSYFVEFAPPK